ncbi:MAG: hypothetical protein AAFY16_14530, partial [Cyanobacteria bacterium J06642_3]
LDINQMDVILKNNIHLVNIKPQLHLYLFPKKRLKPTGIKTPEGKGVEFLEYLQPNNAGLLLEGTTPKDLTHLDTTLIVEDIKMIVKIR